MKHPDDREVARDFAVSRVRSIDDSINLVKQFTNDTLGEAECRDQSIIVDKAQQILDLTTEVDERIQPLKRALGINRDSNNPGSQ